jgi:hypothetical protein
VIQHYKQVQQVFPFWRAVEALTPQQLDKDNPDDPLNPAYKISPGGYLPWHDAKHTHKPLPYKKVWRYTAQCTVYDLSLLSRLLEKKIGSHEKVFEDRDRGNSRLFDISFNELGIPQFESFMLSLPVWAAGQILHHEHGIHTLEESISADLSDLTPPGDFIPFIDSGFTDFDLLTQHIMQWIADEAVGLQQQKLAADPTWILKLADLVIEKSYFPREVINSRVTCLVKCSQVKAPVPDKNIEKINGTSAVRHLNKSEKKESQAIAVPDDLLNSFFIKELRHLGQIWQRQDFGPGFAEYMSAISEPERPRVDIRSAEGLSLAFKRLLPTQPPAGAWPSQHPLAFSQQLAVNEIWRRHADQSGLFAVNGPPGTGKTTLLRDVVAAVVTERAIKLIDHVDDVFSEKKSIKLGDRWIPYYPLHAAIKKSAIVVASANNGAVENISLELPGEEAVPKNVAGKSDYFADLVSELIGKPGWGLLAARLGNKGNRDEFMNVFWWRKPEEDKNENSPPPDIFSPHLGEGLFYHLRMISDGKRAPVMQFSDAISCFKKAQERESKYRQKLIGYSRLDEQINALRSAINKTIELQGLINTRLVQARRVLSALEAEILQLDDICRDQFGQLNAAEKRLEQHESNKPGLLAGLASLGRSHREWWDRYHRLTLECDAIRHDVSPRQSALATLKMKQVDASKTVFALGLELQQADSAYVTSSESLKSAEAQVEQVKSATQGFWPITDAPDDVREKSAPWAQEDWRLAREDLFLAALDVHRSFIENHPNQIISNIHMASNWLQGKHLPEEQAELALDSLSLIVPVISTTFASIPRMFKNISREAIGWLLIDEAGQALPQQAAGAIWRAARTVVVGDPKQLEPVSGIPSIVEGALARHYGVPSAWWPGQVSAQVLADQSMNLGTLLPDQDKGSVWVGCPLRVHRRCDDPMFTVSNRVAYDGLMVQGKKETATLLPESCWIDVVGKNCEGNWIVEEGQAVKKLLLELKDVHQVQSENIFLISPFRDCAGKLRRLAAELGFDTRKTGTVHTTQGKEASVVIFVLGGNIQKPGARAWAASRPNLLNVAVSRAKERLYVIGDRAQWQKQTYFSTLAKNLPENHFQSEFKSLSTRPTEPESDVDSPLTVSFSSATDH